MIKPDIISFIAPETDEKNITPLMLSAAASGLVVSSVSRPTHLVHVTWSAHEFKPRWLVLLRADDTAVVLDRDATASQPLPTRAAKNLLSDLCLEVISGGVDLGAPPEAPFGLKEKFPGETEFAELLLSPLFVRWLKSHVKSLQ